MQVRYPQIRQERIKSIPLDEFAELIAKSVLGNVQGFIFACNDLIDHNENDSSLGLTALTSCLQRLSADYYWPLLEEVRPKLGKYVPAAETAHALADLLFGLLGENESTSVLIHRSHVMRLSKSLEILEYVGFFSKRQASRAMKSGGRGALYAANLCNVLERVSGSRLTAALFQDWIKNSAEVLEIHERNDRFSAIQSALPTVDADLEIFGMAIEKLCQSKAYPYGLTELKIQRLRSAGFNTVRDLADASEDKLREVESVGPKSVERIQTVLGQAIWM